MLYWAMEASEATNLLELSDLNEVFSLVKELQGRVGAFLRWRGLTSGARGISRNEAAWKSALGPSLPPSSYSLVRHIGNLSCPERSLTALSFYITHQGKENV